VLRIDPAIVADEVLLDIEPAATGGAGAAARLTGTTTDDVRVAFGE
jgi:hypothetical protein